jgi:starch synthase
MKKILMVSAEAVPFAKTGGLADVAGSLPSVLNSMGCDVRIIMPQYKNIPDHLKDKIRHIKFIFIPVGWRNQYCGINEAEYNGIKFYFIDNEYYFGRDGLYGYYDDAERFAFFSRAVLDSLEQIDFEPDVIHCHDWQTGMIPVLLENQYKSREKFSNVKTVFTIHNLQYQGVFPSSMLTELFGLGTELFTNDKLEFYGNINYMKGGLVYSNKLSTVSPSYAMEIQNSFYGEGLEGLLRARNHELWGIINGIDYKDYNPEADKYIFETYNLKDTRGKKYNKAKLQETLGLEVREDVPVIGLISRLVSQKGLDLIECVFDSIKDMDVQFVILGTGDRKYEELFKNAAVSNPRRISANIKFDNMLAHRIYAGSDMFLMPSLFEPCGLGQLISLRYGTIPIVRETGGLKDTVKSYNEFTNEGNGFSFANYNAHDMLYAIKMAVSCYYKKDVWDGLVTRAMGCDFSWNSSASKYLELYNSL